jgi:diacylglycerol O-acyltransferase
MGFMTKTSATGRPGRRPSRSARSARRPVGLPTAEPRVLLVSASIGEGHNAAAAAFAAAIRQLRPGCEIREVDTFTQRGETFVRGAYQAAVQLTPPMQQLWYWVVERLAIMRWFYREVVGRRVARTLRPHVADFQPDIVVSTYPLATAGLSWLRRRGLLDAPVLAVLCDFAPHAFWIYPHVTRYFVLSEHAQRVMDKLAPEVPVTVCATPVPRSFTPPSARESTAARERYGIPPDALAVLVSGGAFGLGSVTAAVDAALAAPRTQVIVVCGRNERLRAALHQRHGNNDRLRVFGWVEDMGELMAGVDVVVNNAGGMTATEALARGRALVMFRPIAGHGRACASAMAQTGLAVVGTRRGWLTKQLTRWAERSELLRGAQARAAQHARAHHMSEAAALVLNHAVNGAAADTGEPRVGEQAS